jgi:hypothetical protein
MRHQLLQVVEPPERDGRPSSNWTIPLPIRVSTSDAIVAYRPPLPGDVVLGMKRECQSAADTESLSFAEAPLLGDDGAWHDRQGPQRSAGAGDVSGPEQQGLRESWRWCSSYREGIGLGGDVGTDDGEALRREAARGWRDRTRRLPASVHGDAPRFVELSLPQRVADRERGVSLRGMTGDR